MRIFEDYIEDIETDDMMSKNDVSQSVSGFDKKQYRVKLSLSCNNPKPSDTSENIFRKVRTILTKHGFDEINTTPINISRYSSLEKISQWEDNYVGDDRPSPIAVGAIDVTIWTNFYFRSVKRLVAFIENMGDVFNGNPDNCFYFVD